MSAEETKIDPEKLKGLGRQQEKMPENGPARGLPAGPGSSGTVDPQRPAKQS